MFTCSKCGACCRMTVAMPEGSLDGILELDENGVCVHLKSDNTCGNYESRPLICRVSDIRPAGVSLEDWYKHVLDTCDTLHLFVYGRPRTPLEEVENDVN